MITFDSATTASLAQAVTKADWSARLQTALGNTRRLTCFRDAASNAANPASSGTKFLDIGSTGALTITSGNITGFGTLSGATVNAAADLATGTSVLRLEGAGGTWMQGTLGLTGGGKDFSFTANPTGSAATGLAFTIGSGTKAPKSLDSGTGPLSPSTMSKTPKRVRMENWSTGSAVIAGYIPLDVRMPNIVFDDPDFAASMGDVRVLQPSSSVTLGDIEFGARMWGMNKSINSVAGEPVYEVAVFARPTTSNWPNYPALSGYQTGISNTFPVAFKAVIEAEDGSILHTHEMRDGLPINSPQLNLVAANVATAPIRPFWHCGGVLPWWSHRPKLHASVNKYFPGMESDVLRPTLTRQKVSTNPPWPMYNYRTQIDGTNHWFGMPLWPTAASQAAYNVDILSINDPFIYRIETESHSYGPMTSGGVRMTGLGYEPGSVSGIDQLCGPGGVRFDRGVMQTPYALFMSKQDYVRPRGNEPIRDLCDHFSKACYNLPNFFLTNVLTSESAPVAEVFNGEWAHGKTYYGSNDSYVSGGTAKSIPMFAIPNGGGSDSSKPYLGSFVDKNGRMPWNGAAPDFLHNYWSFFWQTLIFNSPMAAWATKHRTMSSMMAQLATVGDTSDPKSWFLVRQHAYRYMHQIASWKMSGDHPDLIPRALTEKRMENELNSIYTNLYLPTMVSNDQSTYIQALRNLGVPVNQPYAGAAWQMSSQSLMYYMAHTLQLMKATGMWDVMVAKSTKCALALKFMVRCMDLYAIDWALDTGMQTEWYDDRIFVTDKLGTNPTVCASWAYYGTTINPPIGQEDWITDSTGNKILERDATQHLRYQYVCIRRDWLTETDVPCARTNGIALAIAKYKNFYDQRAALQAAKFNSTTATAFDKRAADWSFRHPQTHVIKPPTP